MTCLRFVVHFDCEAGCGHTAQDCEMRAVARQNKEEEEEVEEDIDET